jgi:hypothetical protein
MNAAIFTNTKNWHLDTPYRDTASLRSVDTGMGEGIGQGTGDI